MPEEKPAKKPTAKVEKAERPPLIMADGLGSDAPHLPTPAPIDAYGNGGFRFGGMSHRGSLLCFPDGVWAWPVDVGGGPD